jgi:hypothetical protein
MMAWTMVIMIIILVINDAAGTVGDGDGHRHRQCRQHSSERIRLVESPIHSSPH